MADDRLSTAATRDALPPETKYLFDNGPPMYVASLDGRIKYANRQYRHLQRMMAEKRDGLHANDGIPAFPLAEIISEIATRGGTIRREDAMDSPTGTEFYRSQHYPTRDDCGNIAGVVGIYQNATPEAQAWLETLTARDRVRDAARLVLDWIWETDPGFNFTYVSPHIKDVLNLLPSHVLGTSLFALGNFKTAARYASVRNPDDGAASQPCPDQNTRTPFRDALFEISGPARGRRLFLMSGLPIFDERTGMFRGFRGTARDITADMEMRRKAEQSQRRLADTIENISEGLALRGSRAQLHLYNSKFHEFFAPIADALTLKTAFVQILDVAKQAGIVTEPADALDTWRAHAGPGRRLTSPLEMRLSNGRWIKITESHSTKGGVISILSDITEIKLREEALIVAKQAAECAGRAKGEFLANMSHELRTPLNAIIGFSDIIGAETFGPIGNLRYQEFIKDIHDSGRHLLGVINDILDLSKSVAGKLTLNEEDVDLIGEIHRATRLFSEQAEKCQVALHLDFPPSLPPIWADARKIKQVMLNLISNALKFTPAGGSILVSARQETASGDVIVAVADTGIGIDEKDFEKVLSPFGQVENGMSRHHAGTGLGLPLSADLVKLHGGELKLQSKVGFGTTVIVLLPASRLKPEIVIGVA